MREARCKKCLRYLRRKALLPSHRFKERTMMILASSADPAPPRHPQIPQSLSHSRLLHPTQLTPQNAGMNLLGATPIEEADMTKFRDTLMINVMGSVLVSVSVYGFLFHPAHLYSARPKPSSSCATNPLKVAGLSITVVSLLPRLVPVSTEQR